MDTYTKPLAELKNNGITILESIYDNQTIDWVRHKILQHTHLMKNTRPQKSALHLAGFHRYPELEEIHSMLSCNTAVLAFLMAATDNKRVRSIGNSDITINRSQQWHKDLLRGKYSHYHDAECIWNNNTGGPYRIILYLQDSSNLKIVRGSHLVPHSLENDDCAIPENEDNVVKMSIKCGDIVVMDIRTTHRGMTNEHVKLHEEKFIKKPCILVATVLGAVDSDLTARVEEGNTHRLKDWMRKYGE